ncbi:Levanase [Folsomia candida]|uniref:Levanase n=1 Tax=Folsomia candida TaxID=158441 RepID=A0A226DZN3_FOLCA|nr:Levanase [Folsomia candida]
MLAKFTPIVAAILVVAVATVTHGQVDDRYRPKIHFSIAANWINDPNGMVYMDGEYHLHYQYNPADSVWGPMHWGIPDFRDPKVIQYDDKWILLLAAGNKVMFYSSTDLKTWEYTSEFATQYFVGGFDGVNFNSPQMTPLWMDWGVDNYAAISFFNEPSGRAVNMGWMNNWDYANGLPTIGWRGQMTLPRVMDLVLVNGQLRLASNPAPELRTLFKNETYQTVPNQVVEADQVLEIPTGNSSLLHTEFTFDTRTMGIGGFVDFAPNFSRRITATRERSSTEAIKFEIYWDVTAVEVFIDGGLTCMTALFYPDEPYTILEVRHHGAGNPGGTLVISSGSIRSLYAMDELINKK